MKRKISQRQFSRHVGVHQSALSKFIHGDDGQIGVANLVRMADWLRISLDELIGRDVR